MKNTEKIATSFALTFALILGTNLTPKVEDNSVTIELGQQANAAQTQFENRYALGKRVKTIKRRGTKGAPIDEIIGLIEELFRGTGEPKKDGKTYKFISPDGAKVSWEDSSRACDQMGGKLVWYENEKTCF